MNALLQGLRYSARLLWKKCGYSAVVILLLGLGIGAVTSVFSVVNAVLLKPYGRIDSAAWVYLWEHRLQSASLNQISASMPNFRDWQQGSSDVFSDMVVWLPWSYTASGAEVSNPERVRAVVISPEVFSAVGAVPFAGRLLTPDDSQTNERRVVLSYEFWKRAYGADPSLPGKTITLNLATHTVVGIAPPGFAFPPENEVDVWTALPHAALSSPDRSGRSYRVAARLKPGVTAKSAQSSLDVIAERLAAQYPEDKDYGALVVPMREAVAGDFRAPTLALTGALGFALLLLCINVGYLRLVDLEARRKEIALRIALGADRVQLLKQLLLETLLLFALGGGLGVLLAPAGIKLLLSFVPAQQIPWLHARMDGLVLLAALAVTLLAAAVSGLLPALNASRPPLLSSLGWGGAVTSAAGVRRSRRNWIIAPQIALALIPLCGAGLLIRSFVNLLEVVPGFQPEHRLSFSLSAPKSRYPGPVELNALANRLRQAASQIPGVRQAGLAQALPFAQGARWLQAITRSDPKGIRNFSALPLVRYNVVTPGYLESLGIRLSKGRLIAGADSQTTQRVVVVSEKLARQYFPGEDPLGQQVWIGHAEALPKSAPRTIVGVTQDLHMYALERDADPAAWVPMAQQDDGEDIWRNLYFVADAATSPEVLLPALRERVRTVDASLAVSDFASMPERLRDSLWRQRFSASVLGAFSLAALGIAVLGVFGVTSYLVARRSHEIGVRMAVGAAPADIFRMVLGQGFVLVILGIVAGVLGALALTRTLQGLLYAVKPADPATFVVVGLVLTCSAMLACLLPARRAARVDPVVALRLE